MKGFLAVVLLCLLGSALVKANKFFWNGPGNQMDNVCLTDQISCGCCLMQQKIDRMKTYFDTKLNEFEKDLAKTDDALTSAKDSRTAFSAALTSHSGLFCNGPFRDERLIEYKDVFINLGGAYSVDTGVFTVPHSGVYSIAVTVSSDAGSPGNSLAACVNLQINGVTLAGSREINMQDQEDSATIAVALHLRAGDRVAVELPVGCFLCDNDSHYNTFSGFLLYATA